MMARASRDRVAAVAVVHASGSAKKNCRAATQVTATQVTATRAAAMEANVSPVSDRKAVRKTPVAPVVRNHRARAVATKSRIGHDAAAVVEDVGETETNHAMTDPAMIDLVSRHTLDPKITTTISMTIWKPPATSRSILASQ